MAPQAALENTRVTRKSDSNSQILVPSFAMVATGRQCSHRPTITPNKACPANLYRRIKRRVGRSLKRIHCQKDLVTARKQAAYKLFRTQGSVSCLKRVSKPLCKQDSTCGNQQHYSDVVYKQGRRHEVGHTLCPTMEDLDLVYQTSSNSKSPTYPRAAECGSRQAIQTGPDHSNRMVPPSRGFPSYMQQVAPTSDRSICHEVQQQVTSVRNTSTGLLGSSSGCTQSAMGESGRIRLPTSGHLGKVVERLQASPCKRIILIAPGWPNMPWFWDLVTMSSQIPLSLPNLPNLLTQPFNQIPHRNLTTLNLHAWLLEPQQSRSRASLKQWQQGLKLLKEDQPDLSMRQSGPFLQSGASHQVDFRAPPVKSVADFLMYLFEDRKLQPSTIDGYRSAIADKLGNSTLNISKDENLTRLLDSFHRDRPKGRRGIPSCNLSLVLHPLTKAPFEPIKEASLKYLTFKTVFLLAQRRSEIHAWQHRNIRHQSDWSKVSLYPSPSFLSKNQLAKEGPECVAPVVIPALAPTLDRSLKSDRSLCPVRALHYYLDRTSDIRQNKELVFVSFKKGFNKDISPATISSWIKQTVILCYELSDQEAYTLHHVKAHGVRAFAVSKAFQSGISLEQILSACRWKSHNTFTQFYLKDVAWADSERYHLGPVVAAQQIHK